MANQAHLWSAIIMVSGFEAAAQSLIAMARKGGGRIPLLLLGMACYCGVAYGLYVSYQYRGVGIVNALWSSLSIVLMLLIGRLFFKEHLSGQQWFGIALLIAGILVIEY